MRRLVLALAALALAGCAAASAAPSAAPRPTGAVQETVWQGPSAAETLPFPVYDGTVIVHWEYQCLYGQPKRTVFMLDVESPDSYSTDTVANTTGKRGNGTAIVRPRYRNAQYDVFVGSACAFQVSATDYTESRTR